MVSKCGPLSSLSLQTTSVSSGTRCYKFLWLCAFVVCGCLLPFANAQVQQGESTIRATATAAEVEIEIESYEVNPTSIITNPLALEHQKKGKTFTADGVESFVIEEGEGEPVLLLHGVPASSFVYRKLLPEIADKGYRAISFDMPGLGFTSRFQKDFDYSWTGMGKWVNKATEALELDRFHLVVHDLGCPWGLGMVADHPERVLSLTIMNCPLVNLEDWEVPLTMRLYTMPIVDRIWLALWQVPIFLFGMYFQGVQNKEEFGAVEADAYLQMLRYRDNGEAFLKIMKGFEPTDEKEDLYIGAVNGLTVPKQIIWSKNDESLPVEELGEPLQEKTDITRFTIIEGKHFLQEDQYKDIADLIDEMILQEVARNEK